MRPPRRRSVLALLGVSAAAAAGLPLLTMAIGAPGPLPDLVSTPPALSQDYPKGVQVYTDGRLLLRFDGFVQNSVLAGGPLEIRASNPNGSLVMQNVGQYVGTPAVPGPLGADGSLVDSAPGLPTPQVRYESADGHNHYHLKNAAEYTLWNQDKTAQVAIAQKTEAGFCLEDSFNVGGGAPGYSAGAEPDGNGFCWRDAPQHAGTLAMGITPGWRDDYGAYLPYQWIDVSYVQPGNYNLAARVDPANVIRESDENNPYRYLPYTVAGYVAKPVTTPQTGTSKTITLDATQFGSTGARQFRILTPPQHGTLSKTPADAPFSANTVTYTPTPGYIGADSFTYGAINNGNDGLGGPNSNYVTAGRPNGYPLNPAAATVNLTTTAPSVAISGAPASMVAGTSVQLTSALANIGGGVTWSANGGAITPSGLFTAPATAGTVTVTATNTVSPAVKASVNIAITVPAAPAPAPGVVAVKKPLLSTLKTGHIGKRVIVGKVTTGGKAGTLKFTATIGKQVLGRCTVKAKANKIITCKIVLKRNYPLKKVKMTAQLKFAKSSVVRRAFVVR